MFGLLTMTSGNPLTVASTWCAASYWGRMTYYARRIFRILDRYHSTRIRVTTTYLRALSDREEEIFANAIRWAGTYYTTTPWGDETSGVW
jgi:hypothetical protein